MKLAERCAAIRLLLTDVDGVLTDGGVMLDNQGVESKCFNIRDGLADAAVAARRRASRASSRAAARRS